MLQFEIRVAAPAVTFAARSSEQHGFSTTMQLLRRVFSRLWTGASNVTCAETAPGSRRVPLCSLRSFASQKAHSLGRGAASNHASARNLVLTKVTSESENASIACAGVVKSIVQGVRCSTGEFRESGKATFASPIRDHCGLRGFTASNIVSCGQRSLALRFAITRRFANCATKTLKVRLPFVSLPLVR